MGQSNSTEIHRPLDQLAKHEQRIFGQLAPIELLTIYKFAQTIPPQISEQDKTYSVVQENNIRLQALLHTLQHNWQAAIDTLTPIRWRDSAWLGYVFILEKLSEEAKEISSSEFQSTRRTQLLSLYTQVRETIIESSVLPYSEMPAIFYPLAECYDNLTGNIGLIDQFLQDEVVEWTKHYIGVNRFLKNFDNYQLLPQFLSLTKLGYLTLPNASTANFFTDSMKRLNLTEKHSYIQTPAETIRTLVQQLFKHESWELAVITLITADMSHHAWTILFSEYVLQALLRDAPELPHLIKQFSTFIANYPKHAHHEYYTVISITAGIVYYLCLKNYPTDTIKHIINSVFRMEKKRAEASDLIEHNDSKSKLQAGIINLTSLRVFFDCVASANNPQYSTYVLLMRQQLWDLYNYNLAEGSKIGMNLYRGVELAKTAWILEKHGIKIPDSHLLLCTQLPTSHKDSENDKQSELLQVISTWANFNPDAAIRRAQEILKPAFFHHFLCKIIDTQAEKIQYTPLIQYPLDVLDHLSDQLPFFNTQTQIFAAQQADIPHEAAKESPKIMAFLIGRHVYANTYRLRQQALESITRLLPLCNEVELNNAFAAMKQCWEYHNTVAILFRMLNIKKTENYTITILDHPNAISVLGFLISLKNSKAATIAEQLFSNQNYLDLYPEPHTKLTSLLFDTYWPKELKEELLKRSKNTKSIQWRYIMFMMHLLRTQSTLLTVDILYIIEPDPERQPQPLAEMILRTVDLINNYEQHTKPIAPLTLVHMLYSSPQVLEGMLIVESGKHKYNYLSRLSRGAFFKVMSQANQYEVSTVAMRGFRDYLDNVGLKKKSQQIIDRMIDGIHPTIEKAENLCETFETTTDLHFELRSLSEQIVQLLKLSGVKKTGELLLDTNGIFSIPKIISEISRLAHQKQTVLDENILATSWQKLFFLYLAPAVPSALQEEISILFTQIIELQKRQLFEFNNKRKMRISFIEKGNDPFRFIRATDVVRNCVNSDQADYPLYMSRRLVSPLSFTFEITDLETGTIVGNVETRIVYNKITGTYELGAVGLYSAYKNQSLTTKVLQFIEEIIAEPLRLAAINIASVYGGTIKQPIGYVQTPPAELPLQAVDDVALIHSTAPAPRVKDDIDQFSLQEKKNDFNGYRKEFPWVFI